MATYERDYDSADTRASAAEAEAEDRRHYIGVVIIHGLGDEKRNSTLLEAVNALTFWFNHRMGLALRSTGPGRVWLTTRLTEDDDPDAPASRAAIELEAPAAVGASASAPLLLRFREVWWAQSFGIQPLGTTIRWARIQFAEQVRHILVPVGHARRDARDTSAPAKDTSAAPVGGRTLRPLPRGLLRGLLWIYGGIQYTWKLIQWLVFTPLLMAVLLILSMLRVLSFIGIVRSALIASFSALSSYVMLHWIASTQVYMRDYALAATIRQRFEREVTACLADDRCDRVVVVAHSMGTVIAYEGLTTLLGRSDLPGNLSGAEKPMTFICLAQALRRVWLLPGIDTRRLHGVLPDRVRWIHYWAPYDLVAVGPLEPRTLPPLDRWLDPAVPDPTNAIRASLERCQNIEVVNTDSTFTDHTSYWQNLEQVVGPIAHELVSTQPALEHMATIHRATPDDMLLRRWAVAWRYTAALGAAVFAAFGLFVWQALHPELSEAIIGFVRAIDWGGVLVSVCPVCKPLTTLPPAPPVPSDLSGPQLSHYFALWYYLTLPETLVLVIAAAIALVVGAAAMQIVGLAVARKSPFDFPRAADANGGGTNLVFVVSAITLALALVTSLLYTTLVGVHVAPGGSYVGPGVTAYLLSLSAAELAAGIAFWVAVFQALAARRWIWPIWMLFAVLVVYTWDPFYRAALLGVAVLGCLVALIALARERRSGVYWVVALVMVIIIYMGLGDLAADLRLVGPGSFGTGGYVEPVLPALFYGLWTLWPRGGARRVAGPRGGDGPAAGGILALATLYLAAFYALALGHFGSVLVVFPNRPLDPTTTITRTSAPVGALSLGSPWVWAAVAVALLALALAVFDAVRSRRWIWLLGMPALLAAFFGVFFVLRVVIGIAPVLPDDVLALALAPFATALTYGFWSGAGRPTPTKQ